MLVKPRARVYLTCGAHQRAPCKHSFHEDAAVNRIRWLILILGPVPIAGSSWAVSSWFRSEPHALIAANHVAQSPSEEREAAYVSTQLPPASDALAHDGQQAVARVRRSLGEECRVIWRTPFVLAGDMSEEELDAWRRDTIAPAVAAMQRRYFRTSPTQPVTVLLFSSEQRYNAYCRKLFGDAEISIYGYYKPHLRTLVLNVATGSGTLLHELTHALIDFDFPTAPHWFNEGLASLHEQCRFRNDADGPWIEGLVNWRLKGLQEVLRQGRLRSLAELVDDVEFRGPLEGTNYAHARYFCLYMQHRGVLERFFHQFRGRQASDTTGATTIAEVFDGQGWADLDRDFQRWVSELAE